jgi:hypothetical protein
MLDILYDPHNRNSRKPLKWILFDSFVIGLVAFAASLPHDRIPTQLDLYIALRAFIYSFAMQLLVEYGIKPYWRNTKNNNVSRGDK